MKLSLKAAALIFGVCLLLISLLSAGFYMISYQFYQEQLLSDIERRTAAHREVIEEDYHPQVLDHVRVMEERAQEVNYLLLDTDGEVLDATSGIRDEELTGYMDWIDEQLPLSEGNMAFVDSSHHTIAHVYAVQPIILNGTPEAYIFIDEATSRFEAARVTLLWLTAGIAGLSLLFAGLLACFFSRFMTRPLVDLTRATEEVAKENFEAEVYSDRKDEIGELSRSVHSMTSQLKLYRDSRRRFLSNISHDLRTPLTYVKAYAAMLKEQPHLSPEQLVKQAAVIHGEAVRMERLVEDLFQLTKMDEGHWELHRQEEILEEILTETAGTYELMALQEKCQFKLNLPETVSRVLVDRERFVQALTNIVRNALHHSPEKSMITISLIQKEKQVEVSVEDEGAGIPEKDLELIWERFYRSDTSRTTSAGGSGLGLSITKQIIEAHQGRVKAENKEKGATFIISLPLQE